jgi:hypothetical protein
LIARFTQHSISLQLINKCSCSGGVQDPVNSAQFGSLSARMDLLTQ